MPDPLTGSAPAPSREESKTSPLDPAKMAADKAAAAAEAEAAKKIVLQARLEERKRYLLAEWPKMAARIKALNLGMQDKFPGEGENDIPYQTEKAKRESDLERLEGFFKRMELEEKINKQIDVLANMTTANDNEKKALRKKKEKSLQEILEFPFPREVEEDQQAIYLALKKFSGDLEKEIAEIKSKIERDERKKWQTKIEQWRATSATTIEYVFAEIENAIYKLVALDMELQALPNMSDNFKRYRGPQPDIGSNDELEGYLKSLKNGIAAKEELRKQKAAFDSERRQEVPNFMLAEAKMHIGQLVSLEIKRQDALGVRLTDRQIAEYRAPYDRLLPYLISKTGAGNYIGALKENIAEKQLQIEKAKPEPQKKKNYFSAISMMLWASPPAAPIPGDVDKIYYPDWATKLPVEVAAGKKANVELLIMGVHSAYDFELWNKKIDELSEQVKEGTLEQTTPFRKHIRLIMEKHQQMISEQEEDAVSKIFNELIAAKEAIKARIIAGNVALMLGGLSTSEAKKLAEESQRCDAVFKNFTGDPRVALARFRHAVDSVFPKSSAASVAMEEEKKPVDDAGNIKKQILDLRILAEERIDKIAMMAATAREQEFVREFYAAQFRAIPETYTDQSLRELQAFVNKLRHEPKVIINLPFHPNPQELKQAVDSEEKQLPVVSKKVPKQELQEKIDILFEHGTTILNLIQRCYKDQVVDSEHIKLLSEKVGIRFTDFPDLIGLYRGILKEHKLRAMSLEPNAMADMVRHLSSIKMLPTLIGECLEEMRASRPIKISDALLQNGHFSSSASGKNEPSSGSSSGVATPKRSFSPGKGASGSGQ